MAVKATTQFISAIKKAKLNTPNMTAMIPSSMSLTVTKLFLMVALQKMFLSAAMMLSLLLMIPMKKLPSKTAPANAFSLRDKIGKLTPRQILLRE